MENVKIEIGRLKELVDSWRQSVVEENSLRGKIKELDDILHEPALNKHMACVADRILTRQCCILELQNLMLVEQGKALEAMSA